jgi:hypothetical protein
LHDAILRVKLLIAFVCPAPPQVFDLSLDYDDDEDLLLDWRPQGARLVCCGWGLPCILPEWWYRLLPRQRRVGIMQLICHSRYKHGRL